MDILVAVEKKKSQLIFIIAKITYDITKNTATDKKLAFPNKNSGSL